MDKTIQVGSRAFFNEYEDFTPNDNDIVYFHDDADADFWITNEGEQHIFNFRSMTKEDFIKFEINRCKRFPLAATKFLVKELNEYLDIHIDDVLLFGQCFNRLASKHSYYKTIFNFYMQNGNFELTEDQKLAAYEIYKENRQ